MWLLLVKENIEIFIILWLFMSKNASTESTEQWKLQLYNIMKVLVHSALILNACLLMAIYGWKL